MQGFDVHPADDRERLEIFGNVHDVWGRGRTLEEHVAARLASIQHQRAEWFAGVVDGAVVASLGCYPLEFRLRGEIVPGFAIGAVHTRADHRGRGLAPRLIAEVERLQRDRGRRLALLFSDIGLPYYERLGYSAGRSHSGTTAIGNASSRAVGLRPVVPLATYRVARAACESSLAFSVDHSEAYDDYLGRRTPNLERFLVGDATGAEGGFTLSFAGRTAVIEEASFPPSEAGRISVCDAIVVAARGRGAERISGWLPNIPATRARFTITPRTAELTMLKRLDDDREWEPDVLAATDWLHGIDHV